MLKECSVFPSAVKGTKTQPFRRYDGELQGGTVIPGWHYQGDMVLCMRKVLAVPRVACLHAVKCLVAWGTLGKRLTSGEVNFVYVYGSIPMKHEVLGNCYKA